jgi:hypothetical protein
VAQSLEIQYLDANYGGINYKNILYHYHCKQIPIPMFNESLYPIHIPIAWKTERQRKDHHWDDTGLSAADEV